VRNSFDHLVGACKQRRRHLEAERPGGLSIDDQLDHIFWYWQEERAAHCASTCAAPHYGSLDPDVGLANNASVLVILRVDKGTEVGPALAHRIEPESQELRFDIGRVH
jgi:hypothetical protein